MRSWVLAGVLLFVCVSTGCSARENTEGFKVYGGKAEAKDAMTLSEVVAKADKLKEQRVCVKAEITNVCAHRGCWMEVSDGAHVARVRFTKSEACTDGFLVPRNAAGHRVYLNGTVEVVTLSEADAKHYAEDGGKSIDEIEKIKGPQTEITIFADAVMISEGDKLDAPVQ